MNRSRTNMLWRTICPWWKEIEGLIATGGDNGESGGQQHREHTLQPQVGDSTTHAITKRVSCCAVAPEQGHEHQSTTAERLPRTV
jgi:hypothetical protein